MACKRSAVRSRLPPPQDTSDFEQHLGSPSSRGLGHRPFTAVTGVRIPVGTPNNEATATAVAFLFVFPAGSAEPLGSTSAPTSGRSAQDPRRAVPRSARDEWIAVRRDAHNPRGDATMAEQHETTRKSSFVAFCQHLIVCNARELHICLASCPILNMMWKVHVFRREVLP